MGVTLSLKDTTLILDLQGENMKENVKEEVKSVCVLPYTFLGKYRGKY